MWKPLPISTKVLLKLYRVFSTSLCTQTPFTRAIFTLAKFTLAKFTQVVFTGVIFTQAIFTSFRAPIYLFDPFSFLSFNLYLFSFFHICYKPSNREKDLHSFTFETFTQATRTVPFHNAVESVPFFTAKTSCFPLASRKWLKKN